MSIQKNAFDIPVEGVSSQYMTMAELMDRYASCMADRDYEAARTILEYGVQCYNLSAALELARLLKNMPQPDLTQEARFIRAEKLLRSILNTLDLPDSTIAQAAAEEAALCGMLGRPVGCLAWLLAAQRYGYQVPRQDLDWCRKKFDQLDINTIFHNSQDCYDLGQELWLAGDFRFAELFLREAASASDKELAGRSYYALSELYEDHRIGNPIYEREAVIFRRKAGEYGCPSILSA